jgi:tetratricopeptide (TPR) repeat protein
MTWEEHEADFAERLARAKAMPFGPAKLDALVEVVGIAEADGDSFRDAALTSRLLLLTAAVMEGDSRHVAASASRLFEASRRDPDLPEETQHGLRLLGNRIVTAMLDLPEVGLRDVEEAAHHLEQRTLHAGGSLRVVHGARHEIALRTGDYAAAETHFQNWWAAPVDEASSRDGLEPYLQAGWLATIGDHDSVLQVVRAEQDLFLAALHLDSMVHAGEAELAVELHMRGYHEHRGSRADLEVLSGHAKFCARTGNPLRALDIVLEHLPAAGAMAVANPDWAMHFLAVAVLTSRVLTETGHGDMPLPAAVRVAPGATTIAGLTGPLELIAVDSAEAFDERNGNTHVSTRVRAILDAEPLPADPSIWAGVPAGGPEPVEPGETGEALRQAREHLAADRPYDALDVVFPQVAVVRELGVSQLWMDVLVTYGRVLSELSADEEALAVVDEILAVDAAQWQAAGLDERDLYLAHVDAHETAADSLWEDPDAAAERQAVATALRDQLGNTVEELAHQVQHAKALIEADDVAASRAQVMDALRRLNALDEGGPDPVRVYEVLLELGAALWSAGRCPEAAELFTNGERVCTKAGRYAEATHLALLMMWMTLEQQQVTDAAAHAGRATGLRARVPEDHQLAGYLRDLAEQLSEDLVAAAGRVG